MEPTKHSYLEMPGEAGNYAPALVAIFRTGVAEAPWLALLDTGSSHTTLTPELVKALDVQPDLSLGAVRVSGAVSKGELSCQYRVDIELLSFRFDQVQVHTTRREYAIIGRDILDRVVLHLDGPRQEFYIEIP